MGMGKTLVAVLTGAGLSVAAHTDTAQAQPYDYSDAVQSIFEHPDGANSNPDVPLVYRDDNFSIQFEQDGRQFVFGAAAFTQLRSGSEAIPAIKDISSDSFPRQNLDPGDEMAPQIGGLFLGEIAATSAVGPENSTHDSYAHLAPAASGSYSFTDAGGNQVSIDWQPNDVGALLQLFGQDSGFSYSAGPQATWDNLIGMSKIGEIGFSEQFDETASYELGQQYYAVGLDLINGDVEPSTFFGNLDVLADDANLFPGVRPHDGGQLLHLTGDASSGQAGELWGFGGDGARVSFVIPEPGTIGLLTAGGLLFLRRNRRSQV